MLRAATAMEEPSLLDAASSGDLELVRRLLGAGAAVDSARDDGSTPLLLAEERGHKEVAKLLRNFRG